MPIENDDIIALYQRYEGRITRRISETYIYEVQLLSLVLNKYNPLKSKKFNNASVKLEKKVKAYYTQQRDFEEMCAKSFMILDHICHLIRCAVIEPMPDTMFNIKRICNGFNKLHGMIFKKYSKLLHKKNKIIKMVDVLYSKVLTIG